MLCVRVEVQDDFASILLMEPRYFLVSYSPFPSLQDYILCVPDRSSYATWVPTFETKIVLVIMAITTKLLSSERLILCWHQCDYHYADVIRKITTFDVSTNMLTSVVRILWSCHWYNWCFADIIITLMSLVWLPLWWRHQYDYYLSMSAIRLPLY